MQAKSFSLGAQEYLLEAVAVRCGDDLTVVIGGGEKQHIDDASAEAIAMLEANFQELLRQICLWAAA